MYTSVGWDESFIVPNLQINEVVMDIKIPRKKRKVTIKEKENIVLLTTIFP